MLFGEYLVLHGAKSLAFPLKYGQTLALQPAENFSWESHSRDGLWFQVHLNNQQEIVETNNTEVAEILVKLIRIIRAQKPELNLNQSFKAVANFDLEWGLGSSSTLISLLSQWSGVDANALLEGSFGGSGYDIACATAKSPIVYIKDISTEEVQLSEAVTEKCLFVYLGKKQNSREEIKRFQNSDVTSTHVDEMNDIIEKSIEAKSIEAFEQQLNRSEELLSPVIGLEKLKEKTFQDYPYSIKSLGAWGGDFFLATYRNLEDAQAYFKNKGMSTMFTYNELVK